MTKEERKEYMKIYREKNKEIINSKAREKYQLNIEKEHERGKIKRALPKTKEQKKEYYLANKEKIQEHYYDNLEENREKAKEWYYNNIEHSKEYYEKNKNAILATHKKYRENNPDYDSNYYNKNKEVINKRNYAYYKERKANDPLFNLTCNIRRTIGDSLRRKGYSKKSKSQDILGCSFDELKIHLENQFEDWMNWDNRGNPKDGILDFNKSWDIDHKIPLSTATCEEDIIKLNHYTNLQPLCSYYNRYVKKDKNNSK